MDTFYLTGWQGLWNKVTFISFEIYAECLLYARHCTRLGKFLIDTSCQDSGTRNWDSQKFLEVLKIISYSIIFFCNTFLYIKKLFILAMLDLHFCSCAGSSLAVVGGLSLPWLLLLQCTGSRAHGLCSCGAGA